MNRVARRTVVVACGATLVGLAGSAVLAVDVLGPKFQPPFDSTIALSDAERENAYGNDLANFMQRRADWIQRFSSEGRDPSTLPRLEAKGEYEAGQQSLTDAVRAAGLIVVGQVVTEHFSVGGTTIVFVVRQRLGDAGVFIPVAPVTLLIDMPGGPEPDPSFREGYIAEHVATPFMLPSTEALLLLDPAGPDPSAPYSIQSSSGEYIFQGDRTVPSPVNQFADSVSGLTRAEMISMVEAAARA